MPKPVLVLRAVLASPGDVKAEKRVLHEVFADVNHDTARPAGLHLELSDWETDAYPGFHPQGPQGLIDPILDIEHCDLLIGIFWTRMGTPTPDGRTGTEHEFHTAYEGWKNIGRPDIMAFFGTRRKVPKTLEDKRQLKRVAQFKKDFPSPGLFDSYDGVAQFRTVVARKLRNYLRAQIRTIWGHDAEALRAMDEARRKRPVTIAILGRLDASDGHDRELEDAERTKIALCEIGRKLAEVGCRIMVYDSQSRYAATQVVRGYAESGRALPDSIRIRRPFALRQAQFGEQPGRPELFFEEPAEGERWETAFFLSLADSDGVIVIGNGQFTFLGGLQAINARMPMLVLGGYGGVSADVWEALKGQRSRLANDDEISLMAKRDSSPQWAAECVRALLDQKFRRDARQIWRV